MCLTMCLLWSVFIAKKGYKKKILQLSARRVVCAIITAKFFSSLSALPPPVLSISSAFPWRIIHMMCLVLIYKHHSPTKIETRKRKYFRRMFRGRKIASGADCSALLRNCFHFLKWKHAFAASTISASTLKIFKLRYVVLSTHYKKLSL